MSNSTFPTDALGI